MESDVEAELERLTKEIASAESSSRPALLCQRAELLLQRGSVSEAISDCSAALDTDPRFVAAKKLRARAHGKGQDLQAALQDYEEALLDDFDEEHYEESLVIAARIEASLGHSDTTAEESVGIAAQIDVGVQQSGTIAETAETAAPLWEIVGGADKGGILVREGQQLSSTQLSTRLATGAIVEEIELAGERLHYRKLKGDGPESGWISIVLKEKVLACRVSGDRDSLEAVQDPAHLDEQEAPFPPMAPDGVVELADEVQEEQALLRQRAQEESDAALAVDLWSQAIQLGCVSASMYVRRAEQLARLDRHRAVINDCTAALKINPDYSKAFKVRARAHVALKHWLEAHDDFQQGQKIDFDEGCEEEARAVAAKAKEMQTVATQHRLRVEEAQEAKQRQQAELRRKEAAQQRAEEEAKQRMTNKHADNRYAQLARKQGWMVDFLGVKRGKCTKCKHCEVYVWKPVRMRG
mmetsp:Transcript_17871/g.41675  ORF Transcript_17871/g.41675 Transcript_17871/m.41675 type:complete len:467 (-) Transcript_17871:139-1539(-)